MLHFSGQKHKTSNSILMSGSYKGVAKVVYVITANFLIRPFGQFNGSPHFPRRERHGTREHPGAFLFWDALTGYCPQIVRFTQ
jgi:hypothetical protein